jgi:hypothetical protein
VAKTPRELAELFGLLGHDEREVAEFILGRLVGGRARYGELDLDRDRRDWHREAAEEHADALVYLACAALARARGTRSHGHPGDSGDVPGVEAVDDLGAVAELVAIGTEPGVK